MTTRPDFLLFKTIDGSSEQYPKDLLINAVFFHDYKNHYLLFLQSSLNFLCSKISSDSLCQLNVLWNYGHSFHMNGTYICLF